MLHASSVHPWFDHPNNIWWRVLSPELHSTHPLRLLITPVRSKYSARRPAFKSPNICYFFSEYATKSLCLHAQLISLHELWTRRLHLRNAIVNFEFHRYMVWHVARMGRVRISYKILVGKPERKRQVGRAKSRREDIIRIEFKNVGSENMSWIL